MYGFDDFSDPLVFRPVEKLGRAGRIAGCCSRFSIPLGVAKLDCG